MILKKQQKQKLVEVVFEDPSEFDTNYDRELEPIECKTIGWLEDQNQSRIRLSWLKETQEAPYVGLAIPMGCIKSIEEVHV